MAPPEFAKKPTKSFDIAIVGGGIGGLILALALLQHEIPVTLYEAAPQFGEIGAGVSFGPNATRAMKLISPYIHKAFENVCSRNQSDEKSNVWFDFRYGEDCNGERNTGELISEVCCDGGQTGVHRARFLDELVRLLPQGIAHFGKRVSDYSDEGETGVVLRFDDGTQARHDAIVGCDGIKSKIRVGLLGEDHPAAQPVYSGKYAYRGLIPMETAANLLGEELAMNAQMYLGSHGHMLTFAVENGTIMNVVAFASSNAWDKKEWVVNAKREDMYSDFASWGSSVREILSLMQKADVWALFNHPTAPTFYQGRVALVGDAAHASTPHMGAGAGMAIEDVYVLSNILADVEDKGGIERAFKVYDALRRPRGTRLVQKSKEQGQMYDLELVGHEPSRLKKALDDSMLWVWNHDITEDVKKGKERLVKVEAKR